VTLVSLILLLFAFEESTDYRRQKAKRDQHDERF
jgi:hypothetical protein